MFCRMLRDDGNRMANVRRDHKVKVKRRDKLGKVSDVPRPAAGKQNIEIRRGERARRIKESNREMWSLREIFREEIGATGAKRITAILPSGSNNAKEDYGVRCGNKVNRGTRSSTRLSMMNIRCGNGTDAI